MPGGAQLECAVYGQRGFHAVDHGGKSRLGLNDVQLGRDVHGRLQLVGPAAECIGQRQQDASATSPAESIFRRTSAISLLNDATLSTRRFRIGNASATLRTDARDCSTDSR